MDYDSDRAEAIRKLVAPDDIWTLGKAAQKLLMDLLRRLPKKDVSEEERRYPTSSEGLRVFLDGFFDRHFFQVQDSLIQYFASPAFESVIQRGVLHVADVGGGPAVASLAIAELVAAALSVMRETGKPRGNGAIRIHYALNDTSEVCLNEGHVLLDKYHRIGDGQVSIGRVLRLSTPFPDSITQFRRVARMTAPYDICCLGYVLIPLSEQIGIDKTAESIRPLSQTRNLNGGQLLLTQDKFREDLHRQVCRAVDVPAEVAELKQQVYDSENQNSEHTYTYCRSSSPMSGLTLPHSAIGVT